MSSTATAKPSRSGTLRGSSGLAGRHAARRSASRGVAGRRAASSLGSRGAAGRRDDAEDVLRLVDLYRDRWDEIEDMQKAVTEERLDQARPDATKQLDYLRNAAGNPARKLADAAYSLWYVDYTDLMRFRRPRLGSGPLLFRVFRGRVDMDSAERIYRRP